MKLMILGGGSCQVNAINKAKEFGHEVIVADYLENPPGREIADTFVKASTFDYDKCLEEAKKFNINGVMTLGTDQPVLTCAKVSEELGLPFCIDVETAVNVTNKSKMKQIFEKNNIPTANFRFISKNFMEEELSNLNPPYVIKPIDSQGQRGVYKLNTIEEIKTDIDSVLTFSRANIALIEEYYESDEITVSGWVYNKKLKILTITDRNTFSSGKHIGICKSHVFPSKYYDKYYKEIHDISERITTAFDIENGPIYYQLLIGNRGIIVNEIAARIGGAYEDIFIPIITGVDFLDFLIKSSLGEKIDISKIENYDIDKNKEFLKVIMLFAKPGLINKMTDINEIVSMNGVLAAGYNYKAGDILGDIQDARLRVGYVVIKGDNKVNLDENIDRVFSKLKIYNEHNENILLDLEN